MSNESIIVICPKCNSHKLKKIIYGYPSPELIEAYEKGEIILGGCCIEDNSPFYKCSNCGEDVHYDIDSFVKAFCSDSLRAISDYDSLINNNLKKSIHKDFYADDVKGIGIYSVTEPIIKFLIYTNLCSKYQMWPEVTFYKNTKLLDLALFHKHLSKQYIDDETQPWEPEIAIEMKWTGFRKNGEFSVSAIEGMIEDVYKLHKYCDIPNKYVMQFAIIPNSDFTLNKDLLELQVYEFIDKRKIRKKSVNLIYSNKFTTFGINEDDDWRFCILLWKIS